MKKYARSLAVFALVVGLAGISSDVYAQRTSGAVGVGGQLGEPTGVTLKFYNANSPSYDFLAAWDLDRFFFLNGHALFENDLTAENVDADFEWFVGPGAFVGIFDAPDPFDDELQVGLSGTIGLNLIINRRVELYGQVTPRLRLIPETDGDFGGGVGLRYYF